MMKKISKFKALNIDGASFTEKDLKGKFAILFFYPKDMTPGCTNEAKDFQKFLPKFKKLGFQIFGIGKDSIESHKKFAAKEKLTFPLISDGDGSMCEAFGVWKEKSLYGRKYMGIERSTFIINDAGKVIQAFEKVKVNGHVEAVLEAAKLVIND